MKIVMNMGRVFRMSDRSYRRMLLAISKGEQSPTWKELGAKELGWIDCDTTDMTPTGARYVLNPSEENQAQLELSGEDPES